MPTGGTTVHPIKFSDREKVAAKIFKAQHPEFGGGETDITDLLAELARMNGSKRQHDWTHADFERAWQSIQSARVGVNTAPPTTVVSEPPSAGKESVAIEPVAVSFEPRASNASDEETYEKQTFLGLFPYMSYFAHDQPFPIPKNPVTDPTLLAERKQQLAEEWRRRVTCEVRVGEYSLSEFILGYELPALDAQVAILTVLADLLISTVPPLLLKKKRWIGYQLVPDERKAKPTKKPHSPVTGQPIGAVEKYAEHFCTFKKALLGVIDHQLDGMGYVFLEGDGLVGIDFDHCISDGKIHDVVESFLRLFRHSYAEVSVSGTGVHIIARGTIAKAAKGVPIYAPAGEDTGITLEVYNTARYFTYSGLRISGTTDITDGDQEGINEILTYAEESKRHKAANGTKAAERGEPHTELAQDEDDEATIPYTIAQIRRIHAANLEALRCTREGEGKGNAFLNQAAFFAGRALYARQDENNVEINALEQDEKQVVDELMHIVTEEWSDPYPAHGAMSVINSALASGKAKPLMVLSVPEDEHDLRTHRQVVAWFNQRYFVLQNIGSKCRVCSYEPDPNPDFNNRLVLYHQSQSEFKLGFSHLKIKIIRTDSESGKKIAIMLPIAPLWLNYRWRENYRFVVFAPGKRLDRHCKNLWRGFAVEARQGDCSLYLKFIREIICCKNQELYEWLLNHMAYAIQNPGEVGHVAVVLRGSKGTGKSFFVERYGHLWGNHFLAIVQPSQVVGKFNAHLRTCSVLFANESLFAGNHQQENALKALITDTELQIEDKFISAVPAPNYLHVYIAGNADWLIRASSDERRYAVFDVSPEFAAAQGRPNPKTSAYFKAIYEQLMNQGGNEALLYFFQHRDLSGFDPRLAPPTPALFDQIIQSLDSDTEKAWYECLASGQIPARINEDGTANLMSEDFIAWAKSRGWKVTAQEFGYLLGTNNALARKPMGFETKRTANDQRYKAVPSLQQARVKWDDVRVSGNWLQSSADKPEGWEMNQWYRDELRKREKHERLGSNVY
jgi:hypothetical protein